MHYINNIYTPLCLFSGICNRCSNLQSYLELFEIPKDRDLPKLYKQYLLKRLGVKNNTIHFLELRVFKVLHRINKKKSFQKTVLRSPTRNGKPKNA